MFKVVLWDHRGISAQWAEKYLRKDGVQIVRTLRPNDKDQAEVIMRGDWNFVLIFEKDTREVFEEIFKTMRAMNFSTDNIIFAEDDSSWVSNPAAVYALLNPTTCEKFFRWINFLNHRNWHRYVSATVEGLNFVATSKDNIIMGGTYVYGENHAADDMQRFHALTKKYYGIDGSEDGIFLELGANIGTTGIYFLKKLAPNMKWLAFEPDAENFKMLHANLILNDMTERAVIENCGLGEKFDELTMYRNLTNPGGNGMFNNLLDENFPTEKIKVIPLDAYFAERKIPASAVKYIWIDTEGFEAQVLLGAKNLLAENPAPIFMEFNPMMWNKTGHLEKMVGLLKSVGYTQFIWVLELEQTGQEKLYTIDELLTCKNSDAWIGSLGDIFLIRNLA